MTSGPPGGEAPASRQRHHGGRRRVVPHLRRRSAVTGALGVVCRRASCSPPHRCSRSSIAQAPARRSSCSAGSRNAIPGWSERFGAAGHDIGTHGHLHVRAYDLDAGRIRRGSEAERRGARRGGSRAHRGLPGTGMVDQRSIAVGARVPRPRRHHARREHGACPHRRPRRLPADAARAADLGGANLRGSTSRRGPVRARHADRMGVGPAHDVAAPDAPDDRSGQRRRLSCGADRASLGNRPGTATRRAPAAPPLRALLLPAWLP